MASTRSFSEFYSELISLLPTSSEEQRNQWALEIIQNKFEIKSMIGLLKADKKTTTRFLWLLSNVGLKNPKTLYCELSFLLKEFEHIEPIYSTSFANYWLIAGLPQEDEGKAIDLLFRWLLSNEVNSSIKSRAIMVLLQLTQKYPELKPEFIASLLSQKNKYSISFDKKIQKTLFSLDAL